MPHPILCTIHRVRNRKWEVNIIMHKGIHIMDIWHRFI